MSGCNLMAFDLGASSGRAIVGSFDGNKITLEELHRFPNGPINIRGHIYWDIFFLKQQLTDSLRKFIDTEYGELSSIGIDTWGVDYGLLDKSGQLIGCPFHYRDSRTEDCIKEAFDKIPKEELYSKTGIAFLTFNTLYQLIAAKKMSPEVLDCADKLLFMPDLLAYFLTGEMGTEYTIASTGQLVDVQTRQWCTDLFNTFNIPQSLFTEIQEPGTIRGFLSDPSLPDSAYGKVPVIAVASHDTASAVVSVPTTTNNYAYLSSGTWSLLGIETNKPVVNKDMLNLNYTNEGGANNTYRVLKNIMGLWIIQQCRNEWIRNGEDISFADIVKLSENAKPFKAFIDVDDHLFFKPGDMSNRIVEYCRKTGQSVPESIGEIARIIFEGLAFKYRWTIEGLEKIANHKIDVLHIVGGGSKNRLLNQFTANALNKPVIAGPDEATATGNLMLQAVSLGEIDGIAQAREVVKRSFPVEEFIPVDSMQWDDAYEKYLKIIN